MSNIRKVAISEPLVDVVDPNQLVSNNCCLKVRRSRRFDFDRLCLALVLEHRQSFGRLGGRSVHGQSGGPELGGAVQSFGAPQRLRTGARHLLHGRVHKVPETRWILYW